MFVAAYDRETGKAERLHQRYAHSSMTGVWSPDGKRAVVIAGTEARVESLANALWTYDQDSWLPHGTSKDGNAMDQPVWLATDDANPNGATYLFLADGVTTDRLADYERCFEMFDGNDPAMVEVARGHWTAYKDAGHDLTYWQQMRSGGWEKKAEHNAAAE